MKTTIAILLASAQFALGAITVSNAAMSRNAGQNIPMTITSDRATVVYIWLYNAKTWSAPIEPLAFDIHLAKGVNNLSIPIPFSYEATGGNYMLRVTASSGLPAWGSNLIRVRSAVIWPYGGQSFTRGQAMSVTWFPCYFNADFFAVYLVDLDTQDETKLNTEDINPRDGRLNFRVPTDIDAGKYHIEVRGYLAFESPDYYDDAGFFWPDGLGDTVTLDLSEQADSEVINIR